MTLIHMEDAFTLDNHLEALVEIDTFAPAYAREVMVELSRSVEPLSAAVVLGGRMADNISTHALSMDAETAVMLAFTQLAFRPTATAVHRLLSPAYWERYKHGFLVPVSNTLGLTWSTDSDAR